jgi:DNA repair protein RecN (Recombination protein N)
MLRELVVEGLGVIERAELSLDPGMSALTGETGAGKTLVVAALSLLLGGRADRTLVRTGVSEGRVDGRFVIPGGHPAARLLAVQGVLEVPEEDEPRGEVELIVSRTISADGRSNKARINGRLVTTASLAGAGSLLVEIAGQREYQRLSSSVHQRALLDAFAGPEAGVLAAQVAGAVRDAARSSRSLEELAATERERRRELDVLDYEIAEIETAAVRPGESLELLAEANRLEHAEAIAAALASSTGAIRGEGGVEELLESALKDLDSLTSIDPGIPELAARLQAAALEIGDVAGELVRRSVTPDPDALEAVQGRLSVLARLKRKYGYDETRVLEYLERCRKRREELGALDSDIERFEREASAHRGRALELATRLSEFRSRAAEVLEAEMAELLADLALAGARFSVALPGRALYEGGLETVEMRVAPNEGEAVRPVSKVASGGELSRIALALNLLTGSAAPRTMVFDEVDAGVGGKAAQSIGRALSGLARKSGAQVLVVTHLPQVAAFADHHYRVTKSAHRGRASADVEAVAGDDRIAELSRMLAGLPRSERAREHAQELLELAAKSAPVAS